MSIVTWIKHRFGFRFGIIIFLLDEILLNSFVAAAGPLTGFRYISDHAHTFFVAVYIAIKVAFIKVIDLLGLRRQHVFFFFFNCDPFVSRLTRSGREIFF